MTDSDLASAMAAPTRRDGFQSRWTLVKGIGVHHRESLDGPAERCPVVFVHGLAVSHRYMMPTARRLAGDHPVYLPDLPGFGLSAEPGWNLSLSEHAEHLVGWLDAVALDHVTLLANSFGCQVAVDLAVRHPNRVRSLVLVGPTTDPGARVPGDLWTSGGLALGRGSAWVTHDPSRTPCRTVVAQVCLATPRSPRRRRRRFTRSRRVCPATLCE